MVVKILILAMSMAVIVSFVVLYLKNEKFQDFVKNLIPRKLDENMKTAVTVAAKKNELEIQKLETDIAEEKKKTVQKNQLITLHEDTYYKGLIKLEKTKNEASIEELKNAENQKEVRLAKLQSGEPWYKVFGIGWWERNKGYVFFLAIIILCCMAAGFGWIK